MSRIIIFAVLGIASTAIADNNACEPLNSIRNYTHWLSPTNFTKALQRCDDTEDNIKYLNYGTFVLLAVFKAIKKGHNCAFTSEMEDKLTECVTSKAGYKKDEFMAQAGKRHFAMNTTEAIIIDPESCQKSVQISGCINDKFSEKKLSLELKGCKDKIIHGFNKIKVGCRDELIRGDHNSGMYDVPSKVIFGFITILFKLSILFQY